MKFFTIGYGNARPEQLVAVLKEHEIEAVADVRLWPHRAWNQSYKVIDSPERGIQHLLGKQGIRYYSLVELGNLFLQFEDWKGRYRQLLSASGDMLTERLLIISERCCLLCAGKQPADCHRSIIAEFLVQRGHEVEHLVAQTWSGPKEANALRGEERRLADRAVKAARFWRLSERSGEP